MKKTRTFDLLSLGVLLLSLAGFVLRCGLYYSALDEKNLLIRGHPLELCLWGVTGAAVLLSVAAARRGCPMKQYAANFDSSLLAAFGHILAGSGILMTVLVSAGSNAALIGKLWKITGIVNCIGFYWAAFRRVRGEQPPFGVYAVASVFFALQLVANYQVWCANPQLQDYVFAFLGSLMLMLLSYQHMAFCVDGGNSFLLRLTGLLATFFCVTALATEYSLTLYGGCALWAFTGMSRINPRREKKVGDGHGPA